MGRQNWRTPPVVFNALNDRFGPFVLDAAASSDNRLLPVYCTKQDGPPSAGLWRAKLRGKVGPVFVNPPFSDIMPWVVAAEHWPDRVLILGPFSSSPWIRRAIKRASLWLTDRRVGFWHPDEKAGSPDRDTAVLVFGFAPGTVGELSVPEHFSEVRRLCSEARGQEPLPLFGQHHSITNPRN